MTTGLILALVFAPGAVLLLVLLCAFRLNAARPAPRPGETPVHRRKSLPVPRSSRGADHAVRAAVAGHAG